MRADTQWTELLTCRTAGNRDLSIFLSLKDAFTTSAWKPFRRASKSFARHIAKPFFVRLATAQRSPTARSVVFEEQVRACSVGGLFRFRRVGECVMIYMLTVILVLVGAAASAIVIIAMWDAGAPAWRRWRQRQRAS
jgi:hypothetical protein